MNEELELNIEKSNENNIEWYTKADYVLGYFTDRKMVNKVKKLYNRQPEAFLSFTENSDGSICAKFPKKWVKLAIPATREMSEEQKERLKQNLADYRASYKLGWG